MMGTGVLNGLEMKNWQIVWVPHSFSNTSQLTSWALSKIQIDPSQSPYGQTQCVGTIFQPTFNSSGAQIEEFLLGLATTRLN